MAVDWGEKDGFTRHLSADEQELTFPEWKQKQTAERLTYLYYLTTQDLSKAKCSREEDMKMITSKVVNRNGGWKELNHKMATFRSRVNDTDPNTRSH
jgi:hypothetical protein